MRVFERVQRIGLFQRQEVAGQGHQFQIAEATPAELTRALFLLHRNGVDLTKVKVNDPFRARYKWFDGLTAIHGTVTLDGAPLERGRIELEPSDGKGPIAAAEIFEGQYEVRATPGKKTVRITGGKLIGQQPFSASPGSPMFDEIEPLVPACYNTKTTLKCDITRGQTAYDFELNSTTP